MDKRVSIACPTSNDKSVVDPGSEPRLSDAQLYTVCGQKRVVFVGGGEGGGAILELVFHLDSLEADSETQKIRMKMIY